MSQNAESKFVNTKNKKFDFFKSCIKKEVWELFCKKFKSDVTAASYKSDLSEFCRFTEKCFQETDFSDVQKYYIYMQKKIKNGQIGPLTVTKKFRELHSFSKFLLEEWSDRLEDESKTSSFKDYFEPYLKQLVKEKELARMIPLEHIDRLLTASAENHMVYTILTLMYRAGLSSTEIIALKGPEDFVQYGDGLYVFLKGRQEPCYIPEDAKEILFSYLEEWEEGRSLFYNRSKNPLNTMYISRMMKKYCEKVKIPSYSAEAVRNCCAFNLFAYGATEEQVSDQMGRTVCQIKRYKGMGYKKNLKKRSADLVKIRIERPI